jgi:hypothetical protein
MHVDLQQNLSDFDSATLLRAFDARPLVSRFDEYRNIGVFHGLSHIVESKVRWEGRLVWNDRHQP